MYEEYRKRGGKLSRKAFETRFDGLMRAVGCVFEPFVPRVELHRQVLDTLCRMG